MKESGPKATTNLIKDQNIGREQKYCYRVDKHYKIWFSKDKNTFLGSENTLRLIRLRNKHPDMIISLVYSAGILTEKAQLELIHFCKRINIQPVDFDTQIQDSIEDELDSTLYDIASLEIKKCVHEVGGNMAAASDCVRLISPIIEQLGIYSDFDIELDLTYLPSLSEVLYENGPYLLQYCEKQFSFNNETLAFSIDALNYERMSNAGAQKLRFIQNEVIESYANPISAVLNTLVLELLMSSEQLDETRTLNEGTRNYLTTHAIDGIFSIRLAVENLTMLDMIKLIPPQIKQIIFEASDADSWSDTQLIDKYKAGVSKQLNSSNEREINEHCELISDLERHSFYLKTVTHISGPQALLRAVIKEYSYTDEDGNTCMPKLITDQYVTLGLRSPQFISAGQNVAPLLGKSSIQNSSLQAGFHSENSVASFSKKLKENSGNDSDQVQVISDLIGTCGDQSWTVKGRQKQKKRDSIILEAVLTLQKYIRSYNARKELGVTNPSHKEEDNSLIIHSQQELEGESNVGFKRLRESSDSLFEEQPPEKKRKRSSLAP